MNVTVETPEHYQTRSCPKCKKKDAIPAGDKRVACASCRELWIKEYRKRARDREVVAPGGEHEPPKKKSKTSSGDASKVSSELKKKRAKPRRQCVEYQFPNNLYEALEESITSNSIRKFSGCFSVVADTKFNHLVRAKLVAIDLRTVAKYPLASTSAWTTSNSSSTRVMFHCQCLSNIDQGSSPSRSNATPLQVSPQPNAIASEVNENENENKNAQAEAQQTQQAQQAQQTQQTQEANGEKMVAALQASFARSCGGQVKIVVENDLSHPLGILGHRVFVDVIH